MRNKRYLEHGLAPTDRLALLFLNRWLVEQMLGLGEATEGRVNRRLDVQCLDRPGSPPEASLQAAIPRWRLPRSLCHKPRHAAAP